MVAKFIKCTLVWRQIQSCRPSVTSLSKVGPTRRMCQRNSDHFSMCDKNLSTSAFPPKGCKDCLPTALAHKVLCMAHIGHPGMVKMKRSFCETYWCPGLDSQVEQLVKCCEGCQKSSKSQSPNPILKHAILKPGRPWSCIGIDISGPFHTTPQKEQFMVSVVDYSSRFPEVILTTDI